MQDKLCRHATKVCQYARYCSNYVGMQVFLYVLISLSTPKSDNCGGHSYSNMMHVSIFKSHADINTSHVDINILHVYILMLHPAFGLLSETSSRSEFSILQNFSCMLTQFILQMGGRNMPAKFLSILVYFEPPPPNFVL